MEYPASVPPVWHRLRHSDHSNSPHYLSRSPVHPARSAWLPLLHHIPVLLINMLPRMNPHRLTCLQQPFFRSSDHSCFVSLAFPILFVSNFCFSNENYNILFSKCKTFRIFTGIFPILTANLFQNFNHIIQLLFCCTFRKCHPDG